MQKYDLINPATLQVAPFLKRQLLPRHSVLLFMTENDNNSKNNNSSKDNKSNNKKSKNYNDNNNSSNDNNKTSSNSNNNNKNSNLCSTSKNTLSNTQTHSVVFSHFWNLRRAHRKSFFFLSIFQLNILITFFFSSFMEETTTERRETQIKKLSKAIFIAQSAVFIRNLL